MSNSGDADVCFHFPTGRTESILVVINAVAFEFLVAERQRSLAGCAQVNRRIVFVRDDFGENSAHLQAGRILTGGDVLAFDGFIDAFESANFERHRARKFFEHTLSSAENRCRQKAAAVSW